MRTPKEYSENLKKGIITPSMLEDVLFSYNKRAKNYRNRARKYRENKYDSELQCEEKMDLLYSRKSDILSYCKNELKAIHKLTFEKRIRIEDDDPEYYEYESEIEKYERGESSKVVYMNSYFDYDIKDYVTFINIYVVKAEYYLYYEFPNHSFHHPIDEDELAEYRNLEIITLDSLKTYGHDINDLLSLQFCDKVWDYMTKTDFQQE
jgi:hypothetical protein